MSSVGTGYDPQWIFPVIQVEYAGKAVDSSKVVDSQFLF
jgi:hypothetical protein